MNVLVAGTAARAAEVERATAWAMRHGAGETRRIADPRVVVEMSSHPGGVARQTVADNGTVLYSGPHGGVLDMGPHGPTPRVGCHTALVDNNRAVAAVGAHQRLFVHRDERGALVSTHVGALASALGSDAVVDRSYEDFLLGFGFLPDARTLFVGVESVGPVQMVDLLSGLVADSSSSLAKPEPEAHDDLAQLTCEVLDEQAGDSKRVAVLLGGFDSALVASALGRTGREVHTFTFAFSEPGYEQANVEAAVAAAGSHHHNVVFTPEIMGAALTDLPARLNQPSPQPHYQLQTIIAAEAARQVGAEKIFTGDGCDALFAAYPTINTRAAAGVALEKLPAPLRRAALSGLSAGPAEHLLGHVARVGRSALRASLIEGAASRHLPTQYLDDVALKRLRTQEHPAQAETIEGIRIRLAEASGLDDPARLAVDGNSLTGQSSSKVEGAIARTGLSVLSPFTHPRFRAAVAALPEAEQRPDGPLARAEGKPALQRAAEAAGLLPSEVIYQAKQSPTEAPVDLWYSGPLRSTIHELLAGLPFEYDRAYVDEILRHKRAEDLYRNRVAISKHAHQAIGLLASYAAFTRLAT